MHRITKIAALAAITLAATAMMATTPAANAGVTIDADGKGFVGKGDVQTAMGWNNAALQKAVDGKILTFTAQQSASQSLLQEVTQSGTQVGTQVGTQSAIQTGTQVATQVVSQDLTCTFTNGNGTKTFHRDGVRDGDRTGTRTGERIGTREGNREVSHEGTRTGSRAGVFTGSLAYDLDVVARKSANQYTGFILQGWYGTPTYQGGATSWDDPSFDDWKFDDWSFGGYRFTGGYHFGDYGFGDYTFEPIAGVEWGEWDAAPGENPDDCLRSSNADKITAISNVITPGAITDGAIADGVVTEGAIVPGSMTEGAITEGVTEYDANIASGAVTHSGPAKLFVNGRPL
jgi:hypothetical protein